MKNFIFKLFGIKRYFFVVYKYHSESFHGYGQTICCTEDGSYFNLHGFLQWLISKYPHIKKEDVVITNLLEVNKSVYIDFYKNFNDEH